MGHSYTSYPKHVRALFGASLDPDWRVHEHRAVPPPFEETLSSKERAVYELAQREKFLAEQSAQFRLVMDAAEEAYRRHLLDAEFAAAVELLLAHGLDQSAAELLRARQRGK